MPIQGGKGTAVATAQAAVLGEHYLVQTPAKAAHASTVIQPHIARSGSLVRLVLSVRGADVRLWTAEEPNLYTFVVSLTDSKV